VTPQARLGLEQAFLAILRARHPNVAWSLVRNLELLQHRNPIETELNVTTADDSGLCPATIPEKPIVDIQLAARTMTGRRDHEVATTA